MIESAFPESKNDAVWEMFVRDVQEFKDVVWICQRRGVGHVKEVVWVYT